MIKKRPPDLSRIFNLLGVTLALGLFVAFGLALYSLFTSRFPAQPIPLGPQPTSPTTALMNTTGWLTYTSTRNHFSVKYPPSWIVYENTDDPFVYFRLSPKDDQEQKGIAAQIAVKVATSKSDLPLETWVDQMISKTPKISSVTVTKTPIRIGRFTVWEIDGLPTGPLGGLLYFAELEGRIFTFVGGPYYNIQGEDRDIKINPQVEEIRQVLDTMVSTLTNY